jgi:hypothetical protein
VGEQANLQTQKSAEALHQIAPTPAGFPNPFQDQANLQINQASTQLKGLFPGLS